MTNNTMIKRKGQTTIYKALHRKLKIAQREPHTITGCELRSSGQISSLLSYMATKRNKEKTCLRKIYKDQG